MGHMGQTRGGVTDCQRGKVVMESTVNVVADCSRPDSGLCEANSQEGVRRRKQLSRTAGGGELHRNYRNILMSE